MAEFRKREVAHKIRIGDLLRGQPIFEESEGQNKRLKFVELGDKQILRINIIANVVDKFESDGQTKFATITLDDGSGQIRGRLFGEDISRFNDVTQGDTVIVIGLLRFYNEETYFLPEIVKKQDPRYLLVRKLEIEKMFTPLPTSEEKNGVKVLRDEIIIMIKGSESQEGIEKEEMIMKIKSEPDLISQELNKLLEEGIIYEPKPGRVRYLG
jgi:RecG-like helicase